MEIESRRRPENDPISQASYTIWDNITRKYAQGLGNPFPLEEARTDAFSFALIQGAQNRFDALGAPEERKQIEMDTADQWEDAAREAVQGNWQPLNRRLQSFAQDLLEMSTEEGEVIQTEADSFINLANSLDTQFPNLIP